MKKIICRLLILLFILSCSLSCKKAIKDSYKLLDSNFPDTVAKVFAKDIVSKDNRYEQACSFSPDGREFYYSYTDSEWRFSTVVRVNVLDPKQQDTLAITTSDYQSGQSFDKSGKRIYVSSLLQTGNAWHADIYVAKKKGKGWSESKPILDPVNSIMCEWHPTLSDKGTIYFASERNSTHSNADLYRAIPSSEEEIYRVEKLPSTINTEYNETDPYISPDESFLIFASNRPYEISVADMFLRDGGSQEQDLYICFNKGNNTWTSPKNMGRTINTKAWEFAPTLSPDNKYMFFTRRTNFKTKEPSKIYWISAGIIERLREQD